MPSPRCSQKDRENRGWVETTPAGGRTMPQRINCLGDLLDRVEHTVDEKERVTLQCVLEDVGRRSFGPLLLLAGLTVLAPIVGDIPGVPTIMAILVFITSLQLVLKREYVWLPKWLLKRSVSRAKLCRVLHRLRRPAGFLDRFLHPRLSRLTHRSGEYWIAVTCMAIAAVIPAMEFVPVSANLAGAALTAFGLALIADDGLIARLAFILTYTGVTFVVLSLI